MTHTPGPWRVANMGDGSRIEAPRVGYLPIAFMAGEAREYAADAKLIAAAPELLAALKNAILWVDQDDQGAPEMIAKWRAVIAAAEG